MRTHLLLFLALTGCPTPEIEEEERTFADQIEEDRLMDHLMALEGIAEANNGTRMFLSQGYLDSADYVQTQLEDAGYTVTVQEYAITSFEAYDVDVSIVENGPDGVTTIGSEVFSYSGSGTVQAHVTAVDVQIPPGSANSSTSGCEASDFSDFPTGDIALIQRGTCTFTEKVNNAVDAGAIGVMIFNEGQQGRRAIFAGELNNSGASVPVVGLSYAAGFALVGAPNAVVSVMVDAELTESIDRNLIAETTTGDPTRTLLIGAHLDSVEAGAGINDNGSGTAFVLELAIQWAESGVAPANRIRFAWWGAEEEGLIGSSNYFYDELGDPNETVLDEVEAYLNFDMLASGNGVRMVYDGDGSDFDDGVHSDGSAHIESLFNDYFDDLGLQTRQEALLIPSDSYWPALLGIPTGGLFSGAFGLKTSAEEDDLGGDSGDAYDECYHQACDTVENTNPQLYIELAKAGAHVVELLANSDTVLDRADFSRRAAVQDLPRPQGCHEHIRWDR